MLTDKELNAIVDGPYGAWVKTPGLRLMGFENFYDKYEALERHHREETAFLILKCKELAAECLMWRTTSK